MACRKVRGTAWSWGKGAENAAFFPWRRAGSGLTFEDMVPHIALGISFAVMFLALGCVAFYFLLRGGHDHE